MKNTLEEINSWLDKTEDQISNLEKKRWQNTTQSEQQKPKRIQKNEQKGRD